MKFGVFSLMQGVDHRTQAQVYRDELQQVVEAEHLGFHSAWFAEHHFSRYGLDANPHVLLAHAAARTERILLGTGVTVVPFYHPLRIAEELAMLDILSGGRILWGAGRGYQRNEFDVFGVPIDESRARFQEALTIIRNAWREGSFSHHGRFWSFEDVEVLPKPLQRPEIPFYVGSISHETVQWAAGEGLAVMGDQFSPLPRLEEVRREYIEFGKAAGHEPNVRDVPVLRHVFVARSGDEARSTLQQALERYYRSLAAVGSPAARDGSLPPTYEAYKVFEQLTGMSERDTRDWVELLVDEVSVGGTPGEAAETIHRLRESGYNHLICWMNFGGIPHERTLASMRLFAEEVMPQFSDE